MRPIYLDEATAVAFADRLEAEGFTTLAAEARALIDDARRLAEAVASREELARLEAAFEATGGRDVALADRIDQLRATAGIHTYPSGRPITSADHLAALDTLDVLERQLKAMVLHDPQGDYTVWHVHAQAAAALRASVWHHGEMTETGLDAPPEPDYSSIFTEPVNGEAGEA